MKKVFMIALGFGLALGVQAQEAEASSDKKMFVGGRLTYSTDNVKDGRSTSSFSSGPTFAFMFNEKMGIGFNSLYQSTTTEQNNPTADIDKSSSYHFEPFFRYYYAGTGNLKVYGDAAIGFGGGTTTREDNTPATYNDITFSTFSVGVRTGVQYWFNPSWSMAADVGLLGYNSKTDKEDGQNDVTTTNFNIAASFADIGISIFVHF